MNDIFKSKLEILAGDDIMLGAIKEIFYDNINKATPVIELGDTDMLLGQKTRAYEKAKKIVNDAFNNINLYKKSDKADPGFDKSK